MWRSGTNLHLGSWLFLGVLFLPAFAAGQDVSWHDEVGMPFFFEHYKPQDYGQYHQNWSVVQDQRGLVYVANKDGVLEYDGSSWRLIKTAASTVVRSLALGRDGTVYVGAKGDFGYLAPDSVGTLHYVSLVDKVDPADREFSDVWGTHVTSEGVYFQTHGRLFRWDGNTMKVWDAGHDFHTAFVVQDRFYVRVRKVGLLQVANDSLRMAPGGEVFAEQLIYMMAPYDEDHILIGTRHAGFFTYREGTLTPFPTQADPILRDFNLYHGCALPGGFYALATEGQGVLLIDNEGRLVQVLNEESGFPDDWINYLYADAQGGLWVALNGAGVARVDVPSRLTMYDDRLGLDGTVHVIERHQGSLYIGTSTGLFKLEAPRPGEYRVSPRVVDVISGITIPDLIATDSILLAASHDGLYAVRRGEPTLVKEDDSFYSLHESMRFPGHIWVGKRGGLARLQHTPDGWQAEDLYQGKAHPSDEIKSIAEERDGTLWLRAADGTVLRFRFLNDGATPISERFSEIDGVPDELLDVTSVDGHVAFVTEQGIYRFGPGPDGGAQFHLDTSLLAAEETTAAPLRHFVQNDDGSIWVIYDDGIDIAGPRTDDRYRFESLPVLRFSRKSTLANVYVEENGVAWIGNSNELVRYTPSVEKIYDQSFPVHIRRIVATRTAQVIYGGAPSSVDNGLITLAHADNDLRFEVGAASYNDVVGNAYRFYLEGRDKAWTDWTPTPTLSYHGLGGGRYTLRVQARNAQGVISDEARFLFRVLPPWYQTWWAYLLYLVTVLAIAAFSWRHHQVVEENKRAQEQARELERERQLNKRLQDANESLRQANQLKDTFLANTSHELRTPLTAILGFTSLLRDEVPEEYQELLDPIESNGQRLLNTLNSLLDIAQLRAGMMEVNFQRVDVGKETAETMRLLAPLARQNNLTFDFVRPPEPLYARLDRQYFGRVLTNLIGNAIKFTEEGGIRVEVAPREDRVCVHVRDTGVGIDESFLPHLFDEFKQESSGLARLHEGNGLGLTITARLVELMEGRIEVQSKKGKGSVFTVSFAVYSPEIERPTRARSLPRRPTGTADASEVLG